MAPPPGRIAGEARDDFAIGAIEPTARFGTVRSSTAPDPGPVRRKGRPMMRRDAATWGAVLAAPAILVGGWAARATLGQAAPPGPGGAPRFEFLIVESFDARYQGDTPGHMGRGASGRVAPRIALGDAVLRGTTRVGTVTHLEWNEARESLEVEFNPEPNLRIAVGDPVWVAIPADAPR